MLNALRKLFSKKPEPQPVSKDFSDQEYEQDYELKSKGLEKVLGEMHGLVGHAIIPFSIGGAVDMYYFPNHIQGTGFATMELIAPDGTGPLPNRLGTYELVAFTKHPYHTSEDEKTPFNFIERRICGIFTSIGFYSFEAALNPKETCEIPREGEENRCLVFDLYEPNGTTFTIGERKHHLLLCIEVFKSELDFARENGSDALFTLLKQAGHYPYSDLDREPVV
jgi:hypothetical protein